MIEVDGLTVRYGGVTSLDAMSLTFEQGTCGLIGPNGAGKTTFFNVLSGFVRPAAGSVRAFGVDLLTMAHFRRRAAGRGDQPPGRGDPAHPRAHRGAGHPGRPRHEPGLGLLYDHGGARLRQADRVRPDRRGAPRRRRDPRLPGGGMSELKGRGVAWTEERGTSDEGR